MVWRIFILLNEMKYFARKCVLLNKTHIVQDCFIYCQPNSTFIYTILRDAHKCTYTRSHTFVRVYFTCNFASSNVISHHAFIISRFYECNRWVSLILLLLNFSVSLSLTHSLARIHCKTFPLANFERHIYTG